MPKKSIPTRYRSEITKSVYDLKGICHPRAGTPGEPTYALAKVNKAGEVSAELFVTESVLSQFFSPVVDIAPGGNTTTDPSEG